MFVTQLPGIARIDQAMLRVIKTTTDSVINTACQGAPVREVAFCRRTQCAQPTTTKSLRGSSTTIANLQVALHSGRSALSHETTPPDQPRQKHLALVFNLRRSCCSRLLRASRQQRPPGIMCILPFRHHVRQLVQDDLRGRPWASISRINLVGGLRTFGRCVWQGVSNGEHRRFPLVVLAEVHVNLQHVTAVQRGRGSFQDAFDARCVIQNDPAEGPLILVLATVRNGVRRDRRPWRVALLLAPSWYIEDKYPRPCCQRFVEDPRRVCKAWQCGARASGRSISGVSTCHSQMLWKLSPNKLLDLLILICGREALRLTQQVLQRHHLHGIAERRRHWNGTSWEFEES